AAEVVLEAEGRRVKGPELARMLGTNEADVERMMTFLSADDRVRVDVKESELVYSHGQTIPSEDHARVEAEAASESASGPEAAAAAAAAAEAEADADADAAAGSSAGAAGAAGAGEATAG